MTVRCTALLCMLAVASARAQSPDGPPPILPELREAYERGDYETVREKLVELYTSDPRTELLFALGQVELNLGNYEAAIRYYEQFIARGPSDEQIALAQQAIGAARMRMAQRASPSPASEPPASSPAPASEPPASSPAPDRPRVPPRRWHTEDTGFVALGGAALIVGTGLLYYSHHLGNDRSGNLSEYDARLEQARTTRWTGAGVAAAGAIVVGATVLRWRLRPDGTDLAASVAPGAATFAVTGRW